MRGPTRSITPRFFIATLVVALHLALLRPFDSAEPPSRVAGETAPELVATAQVIVQAQEWDKTPVPQVELASVPVDSNALRLVQFDAPVEDALAGIIGPASAPRLSRYQSADVREFAHRAGILPGHPITVVLSVEVDTAGGADRVDVVRGSGVAAADAAAIDYALALRWIPGTVDRNARSMRVILPVTLSVAPSI